MCATFRQVRVVTVRYGKEYVRCAPEVGKGGFEGVRIGRLGQHERHAGAKKDNVGVADEGEVYALEIPLWECQGTTSERARG